MPPSRRVGCAWLCACAVALPWPHTALSQSEPLSFGGSIAATTDYIYRGVSQSDGQGALQADLHASTPGGTFAGVWASTRDRSLEPQTPGELQLYIGQHFALGSEWAASLSGRADYFVGAPRPHSDDYQEISGALTWLDRCTFSLTVLPNAVRYSHIQYYAPDGYRVAYYQPYRSTALVADASGQWLLGEEVRGAGLYLTAAIGYYDSSRPDHEPPPAVSYLYGNLGLALERGRWRLDVGYFAAQSRAAQLFPYPVARRLAATLSWQFQ